MDVVREHGKAKAKTQQQQQEQEKVHMNRTLEYAMRAGCSGK